MNKNEASLAILDAATMKVLGKVPVGDSPHEVVISADGKRAFVANYGAQTPGNTISVIDLTTRKATKRVDLAAFFARTESLKWTATFISLPNRAAQWRVTIRRWTKLIG